MMFNKIILFISSILVIGIIISCNNSTAPEPEAVLMSKDELSKTVGYTWFKDLWNYYTPNDSLTSLISLAFDSSNHKFIIFLEPDCTCKELVREPAYAVKIIDEALISSKYYEIYAAGSVKAKHPYQNIFKINRLPFVALIDSNNRVYSVLDSFNYWVDRKSIKLENIILEALQSK